MSTANEPAAAGHALGRIDDRLKQFLQQSRPYLPSSVANDESLATEQELAQRQRQAAAAAAATTTLLPAENAVDVGDDQLVDIERGSEPGQDGDASTTTWLMSLIAGGDSDDDGDVVVDARDSDVRRNNAGGGVYQPNDDEYDESDESDDDDDDDDDDDRHRQHRQHPRNAAATAATNVEDAKLRAYTAAKILLVTGKPKQAIECLRSVVVSRFGQFIKNPQNRQQFFILARLLAANQEHEEAKTLLENVFCGILQCDMLNARLFRQLVRCVEEIAAIDKAVNGDANADVYHQRIEHLQNIANLVDVEDDAVQPKGSNKKKNAASE